MEYNKDKEFAEKCKECEEVLKKYLDSIEVDSTVYTINDEIKANCT